MQWRPTMTEASQPAAATADGLPVDASEKYAIDAGKCEACGYFKTWGFKVQNKKSGKMMPGHVTAEGHKIGEGDCPKWAKISSMNAKKAEKKAATTVSVPPVPGAWIAEITGKPAGAAASSSVNSPAFVSGQALLANQKPVPAQSAQPVQQPSEPGPVVAFTVNGFTITTSVAQALGVVEQIAASLRKMLG